MKLRLRRKMKQSLRLLKTSKMDIPEAMINTQVNRMLEDFAQRLQSAGLIS